jgi:hypothetical protein
MTMIISFFAGIYYLHSQAAATPQQVTVGAKNRKKSPKPVVEEETCDDEVCVACSA